MEPKSPEVVAAIDLGSNSFHMIVANFDNGQLQVVDRLREMVRLAAGLDSDRRLTEDAQQRALSCLQRFGQRLSNLPSGSVRAVGTNTLRSARNAREFLFKAEEALGYPIDIIAGVEEARLIYLGVAQSLASDSKRRLVMDIGGGSTEFIIGTGTMPLRKESLHMGCVSMSSAHFADGKITAKRFRQAVIAAEQQLEPIQQAFRAQGWDEAVGASGTLRAVDRVLLAAGWSKEGITLGGLKKLVDALLQAEHVDKLELPELSPERAPVFPGGVAIIYASFKALGMTQMQVSDGALREGLLYDLIGRLYHEDTRARSVDMLAARYHVDAEHAAHIIETLRYCLEQTSPPKKVAKETTMQWLEWAAKLHEIGMEIAHSQYQKHGAYIVEHADLPGFSQQDQKLLAALVRGHRRKFPKKTFKKLLQPWNRAAIPLAVMLRLAVLLHRSRNPEPLPNFRFLLDKQSAEIAFPPGWLDDHPLTLADLEQEVDYFKAANIDLVVSIDQPDNKVA